jgi:hypothetical protein
MPRGGSALPSIDLEDLGFDRGGHLLVERALAGVPVGGRLRVHGADPHLPVHLSAWARSQGHAVSDGVVTKGSAGTDRWRGAVRAGEAASVVDRPSPAWGLAARGALVEAGGPALAGADLDDKAVVWSDLAPKLYAQAVANQWDPATAVDWSVPVRLPVEIETAVVQVMTYLIENEQAALLVPARFLGRIHPHFREAMQFLAVQIADEARHVEVFTRRALLTGRPLGTSGAGGRASLQTLLDEPDFSLAFFLLSVLGEGTFLNLLGFLEHYAPDPITRRVAHLALQDESRHVAFGIGHLQHRLSLDPALPERLAAAIERRHLALESTAGLNAEVFDALVILAAGEWSLPALRRGWDCVRQLQAEMDEGRRRRLARLGFEPDQAAELSALHTRNFM